MKRILAVGIALCLAAVGSSMAGASRAENPLACSGECSICPHNGHRVDIATGKLTGNHGCTQPSECPYIHIECPPERRSTEEIEQFVARVREADGPALLELINSAAGTAYFYREREAVQVTGCEGQLVANVPLVPEQVSALVADK